MSGIGAVSSGSTALWRSYYAPLSRYMTASAATNPAEAAASAPAQAASVPVQPVAATKAVSSQAAQAASSTQPSSTEFTIPFLREGADPAEMAVRMRMTYAPDANAAQAAAASAAPGSAPQTPADASAASPVEGVDDAQSPADVMEEAQCQTCAERTYQDGSDDPGVSFKTPAKIAPEIAASVVRGHEQEHVVRNQAKADREGREVVNSSVTLHTAICPECGKAYVSGGTTRTVTANKQQRELAPLFDPSEMIAPTFEAVA